MFTFSFLSYVAEIGGYMGLLLGVSCMNLYSCIFRMYFKYKSHSCHANVNSKKNTSQTRQTLNFLNKLKSSNKSLFFVGIVRVWTPCSAYVYSSQAIFGWAYYLIPWASVWCHIHVRPRLWIQRRTHPTT